MGGFFSIFFELRAREWSYFDLETQKYKFKNRQTKHPKIKNPTKFFISDIKSKSFPVSSSLFLVQMAVLYPLRKR